MRTWVSRRIAQPVAERSEAPEASITVDDAQIDVEEMDDMAATVDFPG